MSFTETIAIKIGDIITFAKRAWAAIELGAAIMSVFNAIKASFRQITQVMTSSRLNLAHNFVTSIFG